jgi:hypothetical protein
MRGGQPACRRVGPRAQVMPEAASSPGRSSSGTPNRAGDKGGTRGKRASGTKRTAGKVVQVAPAPVEADRVMRAVRSVHEMVAAKFGGWGQHDAAPPKQAFL